MLPRVIDLFLQELNWDIETLKLIFENKDETGGGPIEEVLYDEGSQVAVIVFQKAEGSYSSLITGSYRLNSFLINISFVISNCLLITCKII